jgi:hypothetical protein
MFRISVIVVSLVSFLFAAVLLIDVLPISSLLWQCMAGLALSVVTQLCFAAACTRCLRGPLTVAWARPTHLATFREWLYTSWSFRSNLGLQEGVRVLGVELAMSGTLKFMFMNVDKPSIPTYFRRYTFKTFS